MSRLCRVALALLLAVPMAGCGGPAEEDDSEPPITTLDVLDLKTFTLPLDAYLLTIEDRRTISGARNLAFVRCMARFGFTVEAPPPSEDLPYAPNEQRYGITDATVAAEYGYHLPPDRRGQSTKEPTLSPAAAAVARGTAGATYAGQDVPAGGCLGEAKRRLAEGAPEVPNSHLAERLAFDSFDRSKTDSRVVAAFQAWSTCMRSAGFDYANPSDANGDKAFASPAASPREIAVATADARCKAETGVIRIWASVESAYQQRALERNAEALAQLRKLLDTQVANAARLVSGG